MVGELVAVGVGWGGGVMDCVRVGVSMSDGVDVGAFERVGFTATLVVPGPPV